MQKQETKNDSIPEPSDPQNKINLNPPKSITCISKNIKNPTSNEKSNQSNLENYLKRNSPMQSIKTMFNLKKEEKKEINNQNNSFYQDFSPKIDTNYFPLTPQIVPNDQKLLNKKYFPSKANVCKGNPDSNPKFIIPSSSPIVQYFASGNVDTMIGGDMGFSLENGNSNCLGERISHLSNISQSDMFNYSPSDFFNRTSYGVGSDKNIDGFFMNENEIGVEDEKNKSIKEEGDELYAVELEMKNLDLNYKDDDNSILNKINEMKHKKKEKMNISNNKGHRNSKTNKNNNNNTRKITKRESKTNNEINNKDKKDKINNTNNTSVQNNDNKKTKKKPKESNSIINNTINNTNNNSNNKNSDNIIKENLATNNSNNNNSISPKPKSNDNLSSNEENNHEHGENSQNMSIEFTKKIEDYLDHFDEHSSPKVIPKKEENDDVKKYENQNSININNINKKNLNENDKNINNKVNVNNINNIIEKDNILNKNKFNMKNSQPQIIRNNSNNNNNNKNNLNYINGMNIRCTNLNINNFTNLNNNSQNGNYYEQNNQLLNYLQNKNINNNNAFIINPNPNQNQNPNFMLNDIYNNNIQNMNNNNLQNLNNNIPNNLNNNFNNNYNNNFYNNMQGMQGMNLYNMNLMNQVNQMNINPFYLQNNLMPGYPFFSNNNINTNQNNNNKTQNNYMLNNNKNINNNRMLVNNNNMKNQYNTIGMNQPNMAEQKKKKIKRLEASTYVDKPLSYIAENFGAMGKDQGACRYIQKLLNDNPIETINILYIPICKNVLQLINDPFGNYLIQKIITFLNDEQLYEILKIIAPYFFEICCNTHGTRVLQKMVEHSTAPQVKKYFFELLKPLITPLLKQLNGTFVVQKFAEVNSEEYSQEINEIIVENSPVLSTHRHGCCVIQKYLELKDPIMTPNLLNKLIDNCLLLIIDQFGNYVIQTILLMGDKKYGNRLAEKIAENVVYYAKHKYSSNVVEKCFDYCDGIYLQNLMINVQKKDNLTELILDEHGNYVVQKVLALSNINVQRAMLRIIVPLFEKLKNFSYGERVINRLMVSYPMINDSNLFMEDSDI